MYQRQHEMKKQRTKQRSLPALLFASYSCFVHHHHVVHAASPATTLDVPHAETSLIPPPPPRKPQERQIQEHALRFPSSLPKKPPPLVAPPPPVEDDNKMKEATTTDNVEDKATSTRQDVKTTLEDGDSKVEHDGENEKEVQIPPRLFETSLSKSQPPPPPPIIPLLKQEEEDKEGNDDERVHEKINREQVSDERSKPPLPPRFEPTKQENQQMQNEGKDHDRTKGEKGSEELSKPPPPLRLGTPKQEQAADKHKERLIHQRKRGTATHQPMSSRLEEKELFVPTEHARPVATTKPHQSAIRTQRVPLQQQQSWTQPQIPQRPNTISPQQQQQRVYPLQQQQQFTRPPSQRQPSKPRWKVLWNRVEQGLDELANFEDAVSHGAKRLLASGSSMVSKGTTHHDGTTSKKPWSTSTFRKQSNPSQKQQQQPSDVKNWDDLMTGKRRVIRAGGASSSTPPSQPAFQQLQQEEEPTGNKNVTATNKKPLLSFQGSSGIGEAPTRPDSTQQEARRQVQWPTQPSTESKATPPGLSRPNKEITKLQPRKPPQQGQPQQLGATQGQPAARVAPAMDGWSSFRGQSVEMEDSPGILSKVVGAVLAPVQAIKRRSSSLSLADDAWRDRDEVDKLAFDGAGQKRKWPSRLWVFGKGQRDTATTTRPVPWKPLGKPHKKSSSSTPPPLQDLLGRCEQDSSSLTLLSSQDIRACHAIGRRRAALDVICVGFILVAIHEAIPLLATLEIPSSIVDWFSSTFLDALKGVSGEVWSNTWAPFALVAAILTYMTNAVLWSPQTQTVASEAGDTVRDLTLYSQLYLRLVSALPLQRNVMEWTRWTAGAQAIATVESSRLLFFAILTLTALFVATVSVVRPVVVAIMVAVGQLLALPQWRTWPVPFSELKGETAGVFKLLGETLRPLLGLEKAGSFLTEHPKRLAFQASVVAALVVVSRLPNIARKRKTFESVTDPDDEQGEDEAAAAWLASSTENLNKLGVSSASRLNLQAESGTVEGTLERWRMMKPRSDAVLVATPSFKCTMRLWGYSVSAGAILATPILIYMLLGVSKSALARFDILATDLSVLLFFSWGLVWNALGRLVDTGVAMPAVRAFFKTLSDTVGEISASQSSKSDMQLAALVSPSKGIVANDVWAAHTAKRAWAVRGAHLTCRNGEVLVLLGNDGSGKSRLLTSLVEAMVVPPKKSHSTTKVRGSITVGGIDVSKWDRAQLKRRLGIFLSDVRTVTDQAELMSGLTLEEILEPNDVTRQLLEPHSPGARERSAMALALKITGLSTSLLPRLSSKLSTVVSANEDELKPSPLRPPSSALSPSEWSKVLLAKVLAQAIYDNDNQAKSHNSVDKCLVGSVLVLDDVTAHMSEAEEARFLMLLRRTGAATIVTSRRWATGRLADRITVIKNGAVTESGPHNDLLRIGPQKGAYAAEWYAMGST